jgi:hypothetical protein
MIRPPAEDGVDQPGPALGPGNSALPMDTAATERIRQEADALLVRWLFGPPGMHIRDYVGRTAHTAPVTTPTRRKRSDDGETSFIPAA